MTDLLTPDLVTPLLQRHLSASATCTSVQRGQVGNGQEIWFIAATTEQGPLDLVLRRTATSGPLDWTDRRQEYEVLKSLANLGLPIPEALWFAHGDDLVRPYFVMQRLPGSPVLREDPETKNRLARQLGTWLARLHLIKPNQVEPSRSSRDYTRAAHRDWQDRYEATRLGSNPILGALFAWLEVNQPTDDPAAVTLWGDPGPHNVLHKNGTITGLLDWELSRRGHPLEDLGTAVWSSTDILDPNVIVDAYEIEVGTSVDPTVLRYFEAMAAATRAVMLVTGIANYVSGATRSPSLAGLGLYLLPRTLQQGATAAGWSSVTASPPIGPSSAEEATDLRPTTGETIESVANFLTLDVLPVTEDPVLRRGLKTAAALLDTANRRTSLEGLTNRRMADQEATLMAELHDSGIETSKDLESIAAAAERDSELAQWRPRIREHLVRMLDAQRTLMEPLADLYEGRRRGDDRS